MEHDFNRRNGRLLTQSQANVLISPFSRNSVLIPKMLIRPSDLTLPFQLKRKQFPVMPVFAMTINKSQGQTFDIAANDLNDEVFGHGQLYIALSRCTTKLMTYDQVNEKTAKRRRFWKDTTSDTPVNNVVWTEVLQ